MNVSLLNYEGVLTQAKVEDMLESLEAKLEKDNLSRGAIAHIAIIFIELCQNMINYSKSAHAQECHIVPFGFIACIKNTTDSEYILEAKNIVSIEDKKRLLTRLKDIDTLDKDAIKQRYKELRRSAKNAHDKGAGIGLYDIAKRCKSVQYHFIPINEDKLYFHLKIHTDI